MARKRQAFSLRVVVCKWYSFVYHEVMASGGLKSPKVTFSIEAL